MRRGPRSQKTQHLRLHAAPMYFVDRRRLVVCPVHCVDEIHRRPGRASRAVPKGVAHNEKCHSAFLCLFQNLVRLLTAACGKIHNWIGSDHLHHLTISKDDRFAIQLLLDQGRIHNVRHVRFSNLVPVFPWNSSE